MERPARLQLFRPATLTSFTPIGTNSDGSNKEVQYPTPLRKQRRKQGILVANAVACMVHLVMYLLCITACDAEGQCTEKGMTMTIYRIRANWTSMAVDGYSLIPVDNGKPIRFHVVVSLFFLISAVFHLLAILVGTPAAVNELKPCRGLTRFSQRFYWKQIHAAFTPWRWPPCSNTRALVHSHVRAPLAYERSFSCAQVDRVLHECILDAL